MPWTGIVPRGTFQGAVKCVPKLDSLFGRVGRVGSVRVVAVGPLKTRNPERGKEEEEEERKGSITTAKKKEKEEEVAKVAHHITLIFYVPCLGHYSALLCCTLSERVRGKVLVRS